MNIGMKIKEIEYQKELNLKYAKYQKGGVDLAFRCFQCAKIVLQADILAGVGCRKCGSRKVMPITIHLTWFGTHYCRVLNYFWDLQHDKFWSWLWNLYCNELWKLYDKIKFKKSQDSLR